MTQAERSLIEELDEIDSELGPTYEQWAATGVALAKIDGAVHWWIGDWVNAGEKRYGEKYSQALEATGFKYSTITEDAWVAKEIESCRRRQNLSWSHHQSVAEHIEMSRRRDILSWSHHAEVGALGLILLLEALPVGALVRSDAASGLLRAKIKPSTGKIALEGARRIGRTGRRLRYTLDYPLASGKTAYMKFPCL